MKHFNVQLVHILSRDAFVLVEGPYNFLRRSPLQSKLSAHRGKHMLWFVKCYQCNGKQ